MEETKLKQTRIALQTVISSICLFFFNCNFQRLFGIQLSKHFLIRGARTAHLFFFAFMPYKCLIKYATRSGKSDKNK